MRPNHATPSRPARARPIADRSALDVILTRPHPLVWAIPTIGLIAAAFFWPTQSIKDRTGDGAITAIGTATAPSAPAQRNAATTINTDDLRAVALRRPLVDPPPPPAPSIPAPSPARLEVRLVAILTDPVGAPIAAFIHDLALDEFRRVTLEQATGSGAVLIALQARTATFELAGRRLTLDLPE